VDASILRAASIFNSEQRLVWADKFTAEIDYSTFLVYFLCDFDLAKVEAKARQFKNPRSTSIPKMMAQYREILAGIPSGSSTWTKEKLLDVIR